jgi:hypothetical protein
VRQWQPARIVEWEGGDEFDVALIECEFPEEVDRWGMLSKEKPSDTMEWCSEGFARAGKKNDGERRPVGMQGKVFSMADSATEFELGTDYEVDQDKRWKGASGSPVFVGDKIIGVIVSCPEKFDAKRLRATPLWRILQKPGFCEAIGYYERKKRLVWACRELTSILSRSTEAIQKLTIDLKIDTRLIQNQAKNLANALLNYNIDQILYTSDKIIEELSHEGKKHDMEVVRQAVNTILPTIFNNGIIESVRIQKSDLSSVTVSLPVATKTVTEIVMAGVDRRAAIFRTIFDRKRQGKRRLKAALSIELPPEVGLDSTGKDFIAAFHNHLIKECDVEEDLVQNQEIPDDELIGATSDELEARSKYDHQTYYYIYALPKNEVANQYYSDIIGKLKNVYSSVVFINLTGKEVRAERKRFRSFRKIHETASEEQK